MTEARTQKGEVQVNRYDAEGLRHEMEENGRLVQFLYKGKEVVAEEGEKAGVVRYIRGLGLVSSDSEEARTYYHYASDELGSITHIVKAAVHKKLEEDGRADEGEKDEDCQVLNRYAYDAFGNRVECEEQVENRFGFAGELYDPISALVYLRARFYNPVIGRFLQEDNVYEDGLNLYVYCRNNPVRYVDPSGHGTESPADKDGSGKEDHLGDIEALKEIVDEVNQKGGATPEEAAILKEWADDYGVDYDSLGAKEQGNGGSSASGQGTKNTLTDAQKSRLNSLDNTINDHLTEGDFSGTLRDLQGNPVPNGKGGYFDHLGEMKDSYKSLKKIKKALEGSLKNPNLSDVDRALLQEGLNKANSYITRIEELFKPYGGIN